MINIPANFSSKCEANCKCGQREEMSHIYECKIYNGNQQPITPFEKIFNGNLREQHEVYNKFKQNMEMRTISEKISNPCDQYDPLLNSKG